MTGQDLIDFIQALQAENCEIEIKIHGKLFQIVNAETSNGKIRIIPGRDSER